MLGVGVGFDTKGGEIVVKGVDKDREPQTFFKYLTQEKVG